MKKDPLNEIFVEKHPEKVDRMKAIYFRVGSPWGSLYPAKVPNMCKELIEIQDWADTNPKEHLWIKWKHYDGSEHIFDSNTILQLAEIIKRIQKEREPKK